MVYWAANIGGWGAYCFLTAVIMQGEGTLTRERLLAILIAFPVGSLLSHALRWVYIKMRWLERPIGSLIPRVLLAVLLFGVLFFLIHGLFLGVLGLSRDIPWQLAPFDAFQSIINWSLLLFLWSAIYLAYHFFEERRRKEIEALEWETSKIELELQQLKDQLDPHFIFNCLNSIRALVEEDPGKAKKAVGKLSNTLRNSLTLSRQNTIPLREELAVIEDHLALERIRLEERLTTDIQVQEAVKECSIPPLLVQSLVENGIKHGVSKIPGGGILRLKAWGEGGAWYIEVENPIPPEKEEAKASSGTGTGLENARKRLELLFGDRASLRREEDEDTVRTLIELPLEHVPENDDRR